MRILQIGTVPTEISGSPSGGVAAHVWDLSRQLQRQGHTVGIVAANLPSRRKQGSVCHEGITLFPRTPYGTLARQLDLGAYHSAFQRLRNVHGIRRRTFSLALKATDYGPAIQAFQPDVIHVHHVVSRLEVAAATAEGEVPIVATVHSTTPLETGRISPSVFAHCLALADRVLVVSHTLREELKQRLRGTDELPPLHVLPLGVDTEIFHPLPMAEARQRYGLSDDEFVALFVGSLTAEKGVLLLLQAIEHLQHRGTKASLLLVGQGPSEAKLRHRARHLPSPHLVRFLGRCSPEKLAALYSAADVTVVPSSRESFGLVHTEAMACGCPVIGTTPVWGELIPSPRCGKALPVTTDAQSLAAALNEFHPESGPREEIRAHGEAWSWQSLIAQYEDMYQIVATISTPPISVRRAA